MKIVDCHMHMLHKMFDIDECLSRMDAAGVEAAGLFSFPPDMHFSDQTDECPNIAEDRLALLKKWMEYSERFIGVYWIDPVEEDAFAQVDRAVDAGVSAFKVICDHFYPDDERAMQTYAYIAGKGKPIQFHSGILYSAHPSSKYNRPVFFESLLTIPNLRFSMAHVSWPWVDEFVALYGQWDSMRKKGLTSAELFADVTPGTPDLYREDALNKLYNICGATDNIMFGVDNILEYDSTYARKVIDLDGRILTKLGISEENREKFFAGNYLRFLGK